VNIRLHQRLLIPGCLTLLFVSGLAAGYFWGRQTPEVVLAEKGKAQTESLTAEQWAGNAAAALQKDLGLSHGQRESVRRGMAEPAREIFGERRMADFKIHLRLLGVHDDLARDAGLSDEQKATLRQRREQLRRHILEKFKDLASAHTDPVLSVR
jgi:mannose-6-phosphate isomerase class I